MSAPSSLAESHDESAPLSSSSPSSADTPFQWPGAPASMPLLSISSAETVRCAAALPLTTRTTNNNNDDIFICSYPKSGTTWTQHIVLTLLFTDRKNRRQVGQDDTSSTTNSQASFYNHVSEYAPFFDIDAHWDHASGQLIPRIQANHAQLGRRVFNTHFWLDMLPSQSMITDSTATAATTTATTTITTTACKLIYIVRAPLDTCVSFYHHLANQVEGGYDGTLDDFFDEWMQGTTPFGSWMDHIMSYAAGLASAGEGVGEGTTVDKDNINSTTTTADDKDNGAITLPDGRQLLLIFYDDMLHDLAVTVQRLRDFLQLDTISNDQIAEQLLPTFSFAAMKRDLDRFQPQSVTWKEGFSFLRKGQTGDARQTLSQPQQERFAELVAQRRVKETLRQWLHEEHAALCQKLLDLLE